MTSMIKNKKGIFFFILLLFITLQSCDEFGLSSSRFHFDLEQIKKRGKIIATTGTNSVNYFVYKGQPMGFQYELLSILADELDVDLEIIGENDLDKSFEYLNQGKCDIISIDLTVTEERQKIVDFTVPHNRTRQILVQRRPKNWKNLSTSQINKKLVRKIKDLDGKTIYIPSKTSFKQELEKLAKENNINLNVQEVPNLGSEQLIEKVANRDIDFTVCDQHLALVNQTYYQNIDVKTALTAPKNLAWAVRKTSPELLAEINKWMAHFVKTQEYKNIYNKYYRNPKAVRIFESDYYSSPKRKISRYDKLIKKYSKKIGWDWKLLASVIYQESKFKHHSSEFGLMQLMPATARKFGIDSASTPSQHIAAGVAYIKMIDSNLSDKIIDQEQRKKFIIASYNAGSGHVEDARKLAEKYGKDPNIWDDNVAVFMRYKSIPKYYNDNVVKSGPCKGKAVCQYVDDVIDRYYHYKTCMTD